MDPGRTSSRILPFTAGMLAAYYVVSEALTNAATHSGAAETRVTVGRNGDRLTVEVADDGVGGAGLGGGTGLRGLADRVEALGGQLQVDSPLGPVRRCTCSTPRYPSLSMTSPGGPYVVNRD